MYEKLPHGMGTILTIDSKGARCPHGEAKCGCTIQARWTEHERTRKKAGFRDKTAAKKFLTDIYGQKEVDQGLARRPRGKAPLFAEYFPEWLEARKNGKKKLSPTSITRYIGYVRLFVAPYIGSIPIDKITRKHIENLLDALESGKHYGNGKPVYPTTVQNLMNNVLYPVFRKAIEDGWIKNNPAAKHEMEGKPPINRYLATPGEIHVLGDKINKFYRVAIYLMAGGGLRPGEVLGLTMDCIEEDSLWIYQQWIGGERGYGPLKHRKENEGRRIPLDPVVMAELKHHIATYGITEGPIFPSSVDPTKSSSQSELYRAFREVILVLGWKAKRITAHCLRHFYASHAISRGVEIAKVSKILGHKSIDVTYQIYFKLVKDFSHTQQAVNGFLSAEIPDNVVVLGAHKLAPADNGAEIAELTARLKAISGMNVILQPHELAA